MVVNGTTFDFISFLFVIISTSVLFVYGGCLLMYRKYSVLKAKDIPNLILMVIASIIHIWSTFIVNEHSEPFKTLHNKNCILWTYVFQFSLGLGLWISCLFYRIAKFGNLFQYEERKKRLIKFLGDILACLGIIPILFITMCVWFSDGCYYDPIKNTCKTTTFWEITTACWLGCIYWILVVCVITIIRRIENNFLNESRQLTSIIILSLIVMCVNCTIVFMGYLDNVWGRNAFTILVCLLDVFAIMSISGKTLLAAIRQDVEFLAKYKSSLIPSLLPEKFKSIEDVLNNEELYFDFIQYCRETAIREQKTLDIIENGKEEYTGEDPLDCNKIVNIIACLLAIDQYKTEVLCNKSEQTILYEAILKRLNKNDSYGIGVPHNYITEILRNGNKLTGNVFDNVKKYLLETLGRIFGVRYMEERLPLILREDKNRVSVLNEMQENGLMSDQEGTALLRTNS